MKKQKKSTAEIGTVLQAVKDPAILKRWAEYMVTIDPWKRLELTSEQFFSKWTGEQSGFRFLSAADPKSAKIPDFEHQDGLVVFTDESGRPFVEEVLRGPLSGELGDGGYVSVIATKMRHKGVGKYLVAAAERIIREKQPRVYLFVSESNAAAQRFYKGLGYEEVTRVNDAIRPGNTEILMTKVFAE